MCIEVIYISIIEVYRYRVLKVAAGHNYEGIWCCRNIPSRLKDKAFIVILLLALQLEHFTLPTNKLLSDFKVGSKK